MAYNNPNAAAVIGAPQTQQNTNWKSDAFLNLYARVENADGSMSRRKIGFIGLKSSKRLDRALIERLSQEGGVEALAEVLELDFNLAEPEDSEISLGF